ncbi:MAG TPA: hypothetical protein PKW18_06865 [Candidatus Sumerlaeota bacterium]|jgi:hypothetical protein|nr:MAG: hypothetical protein BWY12_01833 [candidate division BRC1 bacterium ADurb.Bin183]HOE63014.1 hypothetical protein [Candidatus Sumerlaeota bacterium]HRR30701.1 hypothetical protein [Candidatus Sumerlaeia bacterium]HON49558.1 hypothetical protein [Candidatus Sumerlaeota bacterium]HOR64709.1 hypothetical protein [Candidatus Sumerlaeota bacterium]
MNKERIIYSLSVEDIMNVMDENNIKLKLNEKNIRLIEDIIGDTIDWRGAIEFALSELKNMGLSNG